MSSPGSARPDRPPGTFRIGQIGGTDVLVTASWFIIVGLIAVSIAPVAQSVQPGLGNWAYVAGVCFAVLLYLSVLAHEAGHALMAKRYGYPVSSITLHFLGGVTAIEAEAKRPREEFWIAVIGPLISVGIGVVALGLHGFVADGLLLLAVEALIFANLIIGVLNLVPGLPLDGGRVLKAAVWAVDGNPHRGTIAAAWTGRAAAVLVLFWPVLAARLFGGQPTLFQFLIALLMGLFMWTGATAALANARVRSRLPDLVARRLARRTIAVPGDTPLAEAIRRAREQEAGAIITVTTAGRPHGLVNEHAVAATPEERRPWVPTSSVAITIDDDLMLPADISGEALVTAMGRRPAEEYLLGEADGTVVGVLATSDVDRAFAQGR